MKSLNFRTFIGLPLRLEQDMLQARADLITAFEGERISWVDPVRYHVTLSFIGDTKVSSVKEIGNALHSGVTIPMYTRLELTGLASFGPGKKPRVIWVGFEQTDFFELLKCEVDRVLEGCGISLDEQPFMAHLTLGRVRSLQNLQRYYKTIEEMNLQFCGSVIFEKLVFYRSILGRGEPEYHALDEIRFS
jgi:2'-5' RNA ligase